MKSLLVRPSRKMLRVGIAAVCVLSGLFANTAQGQSLYAYGFNSITAGGCAPTAINGSGRIVGNCAIDKIEVSNRAFITSADFTHMIDLGDLGSSDASAYAINDAGVVVGTSATAESGLYRGFITDPGGLNIRPMDDPTIWAATGINADGVVVGTFLSPQKGTLRAFTTGPGAAGLRDLGTLGGISSRAKAVNSAGQVVGLFYGLDDVNERSFITGPNGQGMTELALEDSRAFWVDDLNDRGEAVGSVVFYDGTKQGFKTGRNGGGVTLLGTLSHKPGGLSEARGISATGWVAGISTQWPKYSRTLATVTDPKGRVFDLNDWVVNLPPKVRLTAAVAINRHGQIAAVGSDGRVYIVCPKENCKH